MSEDERTILGEGRFIRLVKEGQWEYAERNNCSAIVVIIGMTREGEVVLVEQYRPPVKRHVIEFPAGLVGDVHSTEELAEAAERELLEETGYRAASMRVVHIGPISGGFSSDLITMLVAEHLEKVGPGEGDGTEDIATWLIPLSDVDAWLSRKQDEGCLVDPKVYAGIYFLQRERT